MTWAARSGGPPTRSCEGACVTMDAVAMDPEQLRKLVRRDLIVTATGSLIAIWTYSLVAAAAFGSVSELTAGRVEVGIGAARDDAGPADGADPGVSDRGARSDRRPQPERRHRRGDPVGRDRV